MKTVTVKQLIESLRKYDENAPIQIAITQYNKTYPVAYLTPDESAMVDGLYATMKNGECVRITVSLPSDNESFMFTGNRKIN